jgi:uncharacterized protein (DUF1501 family)
MKRRSFIMKSTLGLAAPLVPNVFGGGNRLNSFLEKAINTVDKADDHALVLIQLTGGNDGLNTILPLETFGNLWAARNSIIVPDDRFLTSKLSKRIAFHPSIGGLRNMFDENQLRIINSVGYPNQDFSHFKSMDIWMTGSPTSQNLDTGWIGRYLSEQFVNYPTNYPNELLPDPPAIVTTSYQPLLLQGEFGNLGEVVINPNNDYQLKDNQKPFLTNGKAAKEIEFIRESIRLSNSYSTNLFNKTRSNIQQKEYPDTSIGSQLKNIAKLIASGVSTKIFVASMTGFDTHANQVDKTEPWKGQHANLLKELSDGIVAFQNDLKYLGISRRVIGATFSEFGRRVGANASLGTDHGAAAPMLIFGEQSLGGILGDNPRIEQYANPDTNIPMQYDFRSVFASILKDWFCVNQNTLETVFNKNFQYLPIVSNYDCLGITSNEEIDENKNTINNNRDANTKKILAFETLVKGENKLVVYSNPFSKTLKIEFEAVGGHCLLQIFNPLGQVISTIIDTNLKKGFYQTLFDGEYLPDAIYFVRFQNNAYQKVLNVIKRSN